MGSTLQRYNQARKKQDNSKQRAQAKKVISQTPAGVSNFASVASKIRNLYEHYAALSDSEGFADTIVKYVSKSTLPSATLNEIYKIIGAYKKQPCSGETDDQIEMHAYEQKRLDSIHQAVQEVLHS